jgi:hypothetical protein
MTDTIIQKIQDNVAQWRDDHYKCTTPAITPILSYNNEQGYLRNAQLEALEAYWYLRLKLKTPMLMDLYRKHFPRNGDLAAALGIKSNQIMEMLANGEDPFEKIKQDETFAKEMGADTLHESLNLNYPSYILALAMGAGKTVLIGAIIATEFSMSLEYPEENFMKNALVFAPGTTIIESLRELCEMPFDKILPSDHHQKFQGNLKIIFTSQGEKDIPVIEGSSHNLVITNTEKIILKKMSQRKNQSQKSFEEEQERTTLLENARLKKITSLPKLGVFSDEAHHTYGNKLGKELKKVRTTINHLADKTNIICVVNTTGTPYDRRKMLKDVVFYYSLQQGIKDNILKSLHRGVKSYDFSDEGESNEEIIADIIKDFFQKYQHTQLPNGAKSKIAFYFASQEELNNAKGIIENALIVNQQDSGIILMNTQKSTKKEIESFHSLNNPDNPKRVILLVGKGTEGWNCPSLFATALVRKLSSSNNFILQAATRCLRQVAGNKETARIYLEMGNQKILEKELKENFDMSLMSLDRFTADVQTQKLTIRKTQYPLLEITRKIKKTVKDEQQQKDILLTKPESNQVSAYKSTSSINFETRGFMLTPTGEKIEIIPERKFYDLYTASQKIAQNYHLQTSDILEKLQNIYPEKELPKYHLELLQEQIERQTKNYKTITEEITEVLAIIKIYDENNNPNFEQDQDKSYFHTIRYKKGTYGANNELLIHHEKEDLGFHYTPYNFDSQPERVFFNEMLAELEVHKKDVEDIYFTGGITSPKKTDFYFQYKGIDGGYHNYFPDFLIVKKDNSFLIVEIKAKNEEGNPIVQAKAKSVKELENINKNKIKYQIIYTEKSWSTKDKVKIQNWLGKK